MAALMRSAPTLTAQHHCSMGVGSRPAGPRGRAGRAPWVLLAVACSLAGYLLGARLNAHELYPLEEAAFLPPPMQQPQPPSAHAAQARQGSTGAQPPVVLLAPQLPPPLVPGRSGDAVYTIAPFQVLSWYPRIVLFPNFLSRAQAAHVIELATPRLEPSQLGVLDVPFHPGAGRTSRQVRSSNGAFLDPSMDPDGFLGWLEERIAAVTLIPPSHGEAFNVLSYGRGQHYNSHLDAFDSLLLARSRGAGGQRMATFLMYLSDVDAGGETVFKHEGKYGMAREVTNATSCAADDFKIKPRAGDAVLFFSLNHDLSLNPRSFHGSCPVVSGRKWVMTKWLHDKPVAEWDGEGPRAR